MSEAPWSRLLIELARLAPEALTGVDIDADARSLRLSLRHAVSASPPVSLAAEIAMSFDEADRVGRRLGKPGEEAAGRDAAAWLETREPLQMLATVALIRALMRVGTADAF